MVLVLGKLFLLCVQLAAAVAAGVTLFMLDTNFWQSASIGYIVGLSAADAISKLRDVND